MSSKDGDRIANSVDPDRESTLFTLTCLSEYSKNPKISGSVRVAKRLSLLTSDHGVAGSNPTGGEILPEPKRRFMAQSLSCSPFHRLEMTEIQLKGRKTLTHPSILNFRTPEKFAVSTLKFEKHGFTIE